MIGTTESKFNSLDGMKNNAITDESGKLIIKREIDDVLVAHHVF